MKLKFSIKPAPALFTLLTLLATVGSHAGNFEGLNFLPRQDTIAPPPPPGSAMLLTGPESACLGETSVYSTDVPLGCICQWSVNGAIQPETGQTLSITWLDAGPQTVSVLFICNGQSTDPESLPVMVNGTPAPTPIEGDELVCEYTFHTYSTTINPGDSCQWTVNGVLMAEYGPSITYSFGGAGNYHFEVVVHNPCGTSTPEELDVMAQGTAPNPPGPIQGPGQACTGNTSTYTTTVGPGESCAWWIDGIPQASSGTTLLVTWDDWGDRVIEARAVSACGTGNPAYKATEVMYQPLVDLGPDMAIFQGETITLAAGNPGSEYLWSTGETSSSIEVSLAGEYWVEVSNFCGTASDSIFIEVIIGILENAKGEPCIQVSSRQGMILIENPKAFQRLEILSTSGALIYTGEPLASFVPGSPGIYIVRLLGKDGLCSGKVLVSR